MFIRQDESLNFLESVLFLVLLNKRVFRIFMFHVIVLLMTSLSTIWHEGNIQRKLIAHQRYVRASCLPFPGTWLLKTLAHAKLSRAAAATYSCYKNNIGSFVQTRERWFVLLLHFRLDCSFSAAISHNTHFCTGVFFLSHYFEAKTKLEFYFNDPNSCSK